MQLATCFVLKKTVSGLLQGSVIYKDAMILAVHRGAIIDFLMLLMQEFDVIRNHTSYGHAFICICVISICSF